MCHFIRIALLSSRFQISSVFVMDKINHKISTGLEPEHQSQPISYSTMFSLINQIAQQSSSNSFAEIPCAPSLGRPLMIASMKRKHIKAYSYRYQPAVTVVCVQQACRYLYTQCCVDLNLHKYCDQTQLLNNPELISHQNK